MPLTAAVGDMETVSQVALAQPREPGGRGWRPGVVRVLGGPPLLG